MRTSNYREMLPEIPSIFETERAARVVAPTPPASIRVRADESARLTLWNKKKRKREREIGREKRKKRSFAARKWERKVSKNGARLRCGVAVTEGWPAILRIFPPPMAVALPTDALPPLPSTSPPFPTSQKSPCPSPPPPPPPPVQPPLLPPC